jgi:hypothetical protein
VISSKDGGRMFLQNAGIYLQSTCRYSPDHQRHLKCCGSDHYSLWPSNAARHDQCHIADDDG